MVATSTIVKIYFILDSWKRLEESLSDENINLVEEANLIDKVWSDLGGRDNRPSNELITLSQQFSGTHINYGLW